MEMLQVVWKQHLRPRAVVGYGVKIFLPSPPNYVTRSPGSVQHAHRSKLIFYANPATQLNPPCDLLSCSLEPFRMSITLIFFFCDSELLS